MRRCRRGRRERGRGWSVNGSVFRFRHCFRNGTLALREKPRTMLRGIAPRTALLGRLAQRRIQRCAGSAPVAQAGAVVRLISGQEGGEGAAAAVRGWVRTARRQKQVSFVEVNDGSCMENIQVVVDGALEAGIGAGTAVEAAGVLKTGPRGGSLELHATDLRVLGSCDARAYPLAKKVRETAFARRCHFSRCCPARSATRSNSSASFCTSARAPTPSEPLRECGAQRRLPSTT